MKIPVKFSITLVVSFIGLFVAWKHYFPHSVIHYRLDVTFEVDGVPITGGAVQKLVVERVYGLGQVRAEWWTFGEAVRVNLPGYGAVYVLMTSPTPDGTYTFATKGRFDFLVSSACKLKEQRGDRNWNEYVRMIGQVSGQCDVPEHSLPLMVRFRDENDPTSVERIFPNQLPTHYKEHVRFVDAKINITSEPVTYNIKAHLPWLSTDREKRLSPNFLGSANPNLSETLKYGYFSRKE
ncbi:hypothetical protein [Roseibium sp. M-1]